MLTIEDIRAAIAERADGSWTAEETPIFRAGVEAGDAGSLLFGLLVDDDTGRARAADLSIFEAIEAPKPPPSVDWRTAGVVTPVKDQSRCGACVAFATCAAMESSIWIRTGAPVSLSEGHLFHCNGGSCKTGWGLSHGLDAARHGVGLEKDLPWAINGLCVQIPSVARVKNYVAHKHLFTRKNAVAAGPVLAGMKVYQDLLAYRGGIYQHVVGDFVGNHAVCVVGYDDDDGAWLVKNSWGQGFGDGGFSRIAYDQSGLDTDHPFYSVETLS